MKYKKDFHTCLVGKVDRYDNKAHCVDCRKEMAKEVRARHVLRSYDECAHVWAQQKLGYGKCYSMYFEGRSIWSYGSHFEIARFISPDVVLYTTRGYSNTTSKHKWAVRDAISHKTVFEVPDFDDHTKNALHFIDLIQGQVTTIKKGRASLIERVGALTEYQATAKKYLDAFASYVAAPERRTLRGLIRKVFFTPDEMAAMAEKSARHEASAERAQATRTANDRIRWANRGRTQDPDRAQIEALTEIHERYWADEIADMTRAAWIAGDDRARLPYDGPTLLRVKDGEIETSRGAYVPIEDARKFWAVLKSGQDITGMEIGHYTVTGIHDGKLVIGCHRIPVRELARMAVTIGLEREAA